MTNSLCVFLGTTCPTCGEQDLSQYIQFEESSPGSYKGEKFFTCKCGVSYVDFAEMSLKVTPVYVERPKNHKYYAVIAKPEEGRTTDYGTT
ncbi:MAG: hypothetical protein FWG40_00875 [Peptococcaceae bacterium]|nr:hypothetical protein [Peptococcaceae bacterium]